MADTEEAKEEVKEVDSVVEVEMAAATAEEEAKGAESAAATAEDLAAEDSAVAATADSAEDSAAEDSAVDSAVDSVLARSRTRRILPTRLNHSYGSHSPP